MCGSDEREKNRARLLHALATWLPAPPPPKQKRYEPHAVVLLVRCQKRVSMLPAIVDTGASQSCIPRRCCGESCTLLSGSGIFESFDGRRQTLPFVRAATTYIQPTKNRIKPPVHFNVLFAVSEKDAILGHDLIDKFALQIDHRGTIRKDTQERISLPLSKAEGLIESGQTSNFQCCG
eukprot:Blabericola_migrator_1__1870@NODE_150_length_12827_cov_208_685893_g131_i0_p7_GENE_NODE_150_length_12827_cov_208_685893_g131_i0NODE_150_length_12827_cov_208_685893_g131_i0_p7_ORF_typecomplete_len178_score17_14RVP/PF00077_20/1_6e07Asp_protease/PF09668_10/1_1e05gagasp_proteas/PF13975_6/0_0012RVP_2/PF08284_11/0_014RVP_2/PF08284_11/1_5e03Asp_protease_2/PF13650_6/0_055Asp_protease_2/PF13650_6/1_8e04_NODE_150_length_12827_cov_208_685893_g131_i064126945